MSQPKLPLPAKLVMGFLFRDFDLQHEVLTLVCDRFGPLDFLTEAQPFSYTSYYEREMGPGIYRQTGSFLDLVETGQLPDIKLFTNDLEIRFSHESRRAVNIDPGLLSEERLLLATGKNYTHRVHLRQGIYADLTLIYQRDAYRPLPWTYPDHQNPMLLHFLGILRQKLIFQRNRRLPRKGVRQETSHDL